jgi:hypothetical protein
LPLDHNLQHRPEVVAEASPRHASQRPLASRQCVKNDRGEHKLKPRPSGRRRPRKEHHQHRGGKVTPRIELRAALCSRGIGPRKERSESPPERRAVMRYSAPALWGESNPLAPVTALAGECTRAIEMVMVVRLHPPLRPSSAEAKTAEARAHALRGRGISGRVGRPKSFNDFYASESHRETRLYCLHSIFSARIDRPHGNGRPLDRLSPSLCASLSPAGCYRQD